MDASAVIPVHLSPCRSHGAPAWLVAESHWLIETRHTYCEWTRAANLRQLRGAVQLVAESQKGRGYAVFLVRTLRAQTILAGNS